MRKTIKNKSVSVVTSKKPSDSSRPNTAEPGEIKLLFLGEYYNVHTMQMHPVTKKFIEREAQRLIEWSMTDDALLLYDFTDQAGYDPETFFRWCNEYPEMNSARQFAIRRIGARREKGAMNRKYAEATVHRTLGHYNEIWRDETRKAAELKELVTQAENKIIIIEQFPSPQASINTLDPEDVGAREHAKTANSRTVGIRKYENE